jgi:hypothetical protein
MYSGEVVFIHIPSLKTALQILMIFDIVGGGVSSLRAAKQISL